LGHVHLAFVSARRARVLLFSGLGGELVSFIVFLKHRIHLGVDGKVNLVEKKSAAGGMAHFALSI